MCGIYAVFGKVDIDDFIINFSKLKNRGPDFQGIKQGKNFIIGMTRLKIVGGDVPLPYESEGNIISANCEIYNYKTLRPKATNDIEAIEKTDFKSLNNLRGMFAFVKYKEGNILIARDQIGIIPLYYAFHKNNLYVSSELKAVKGLGAVQFPAGHYTMFKLSELSRKTVTPVRYYNPRYLTEKKFVPMGVLSDIIRKKFIFKVNQRARHGDISEGGLIISGGLDSSLVAAIAVKANPEIKWKSYTVGLKDSTDVKYAKMLADYLKTDHTVLEYTAEEGVNALYDTIKAIETYDITTVRSSVPQYLLAQKIRSDGIKWVLTGETADELLAGYKYFKYAPSPKELQDEIIEKLKLLPHYDLMRSNKTMAAWGVESRVPFSDADVVDLLMLIDPKDKMWDGKTKIEKECFRKLFTDILPEKFLMRRKEQFSDGVGDSWISCLKKHSSKITDKELKHSGLLTKEEVLYKNIFDKIFPGENQAIYRCASICCSTVRGLKWTKKQEGDPSGRSL